MTYSRNSTSNRQMDSADRIARVALSVRKQQARGHNSLARVPAAAGFACLLGEKQRMTDCLIDVQATADSLDQLVTLMLNELASPAGSESSPRTLLWYSLPRRREILTEDLSRCCEMWKGFRTVEAPRLAADSEARAAFNLVANLMERGPDGRVNLAVGVAGSPRRAMSQPIPGVSHRLREMRSLTTARESRSRSR